MPSYCKVLNWASEASPTLGCSIEICMIYIRETAPGHLKRLKRGEVEEKPKTGEGGH